MLIVVFENNNRASFCYRIVELEHCTWPGCSICGEPETEHNKYDIGHSSDLFCYARGWKAFSVRSFHCSILWVNEITELSKIQMNLFKLSHQSKWKHIAMMVSAFVSFDDRKACENHSRFLWINNLRRFISAHRHGFAKLRLSLDRQRRLR